MYNQWILPSPYTEYTCWLRVNIFFEVDLESTRYPNRASQAKKPTLDEIQECQIILNRTRMAFTEKLPLLSPFQITLYYYSLFVEYSWSLFKKCSTIQLPII